MLYQFGICELQLNVAKIICEGFTAQPFHIFKKKGLWPKIANRTNRFGKHIAIIVICAMFAPERKGLARWTARYQIDISCNIAITELLNIFSKELPVTERLQTTLLVCPNCDACIRISLYNNFGTKASPMNP